MTKIAASDFVRWLQKHHDDKCGYIMGTSGQAPKDLGKNSWYFTQYHDRGEYTAAQDAKAQYWYKNAPRVFDCAGMAEGAVVEMLGLPLKDVNTKARYIYSDWCAGANSTNMSKLPREPGVAVFKTRSKPGAIHHIGYLERPVVEGDTAGDWYVIEAKGVMYGVVRTRLNNDKNWNCWGYMKKYFDYKSAPPQPAPVKPGQIRITGGSVNLRTGPGTEYDVGTVAHYGDTYDRAKTDGWTPVKVGDEVLWVSDKYAEVVKI